MGITLKQRTLDSVSEWSIMTETQRKELARLYVEEKLSLRELEARTGYCKSTIRWNLVEAGVQMRLKGAIKGKPRPIPANIRRRLIVMRYRRARGDTLQEIGDTYGLSRQAVQQFLDYHKDTK